MQQRRGDMERCVREILLRAAFDEAGPLTFGRIRDTTIQRGGGDPDRECLTPATVRSLRRVLNVLIDRGEARIVAGTGGQKDPFRYAIVEAATAAPVKKPRKGENARRW
jgi:hypothetical protein